MSTGVLYQTRKKIRKRLNLLLHMIWADRRDHLVGDMTPLAACLHHWWEKQEDRWIGPQLQGLLEV